MVDEKNVKNESIGMSQLGIYAVVLKQNVDGKIINIYDEPFIVPQLKVKGFMQNLVNNPSSPYYDDLKDKFLVEVGSIDSLTMKTHIHSVPEYVGILTDYIKLNLRRYHQTIQVLNYMPKGYYKMSAEQQQDIQSKIDEQITEYVTKYVIPELDLTSIDKNSPDFKNKISELMKLPKKDC